MKLVALNGSCWRLPELLLLACHQHADFFFLRMPPKRHDHGATRTVERQSREGAEDVEQKYCALHRCFVRSEVWNSDHRNCEVPSRRNENIRRSCEKGGHTRFLHPKCLFITCKKCVKTWIVAENTSCAECEAAERQCCLIVVAHKSLYSKLDGDGNEKKYERTSIVQLCTKCDLTRLLPCSVSLENEDGAEGNGSGSSSDSSNEE